MRIWIYGGTKSEVQAILHKISASDTVIGTSVCIPKNAAFPQSGLTPAMYAIICGEIDILVTTVPLGSNLAQSKKFCELFANYGVSVKSASNLVSKSS